MIRSKTLIKICGITSTEQALQIAELGVDAIGIISVEESPRYVPALKKREIFRNLKEFFPNIKRVSVVKNMIIKNNLKNLIDYENVLQLHGDEDHEYCRVLKTDIPNIEIWKAFRIKTIKDIEDIESYAYLLDAVLLDSWNKETYGGSGEKIKSKFLKDLQFRKTGWLAGGISLDWIDEILSDIRPDGLDISSSVEVYPGIKNLEATKNIIDKIKS